MRYEFSAQFLRISPPDTSFGDSWESLCYALTSADTNDPKLVRVVPPDRGIDFWSPASRRAYQCKSDERGAFGSMNAQSSVDSLKTAVGVRGTIVWDYYAFSTNANYTGVALQTILKEAHALALGDKDIEFLGPEHWDKLCQRFPSIAQERLDYRISLTEAQVIEALRKSRYFENVVQEAQKRMLESPETVILANNRTPIELSVPFSKELTIEKLLDVATQTLGVSLDWQNFTDTRTSCGPSISITVDQVPQPFKAKLADLPPDGLKKLQFFIQLRWRDEIDITSPASDGEKGLAFLRVHPDMVVSKDTPGLDEKLDRGSLTEAQRRELTLGRTEALIRYQIWENARKLKLLSMNPAFAVTQSSAPKRMDSKHLTIKDVPRKFMDETGQTLADYSVALGYSQSFKGTKFTGIGSGVLVCKGGRFGILTARHCVDKPGPELRLGTPGGDVLYLVLQRGRGVLLQPEGVVKHLLTVPKSEEYGPDLAFIEVLPGDGLDRVKAFGSFWALDKDPVRIASSFGKLGTLLATTGFPGVHYNTVIEGNLIRHQIRHMAYYFINGPGDTFEIEGWDYIENMCDYSPSSELPESFRGMSGGPMWGLHFEVDEANEQFKLTEFALLGISFYQTAVENEQRKLRAHYVWSIYDVAWKRF